MQNSTLLNKVYNLMFIEEYDPDISNNKLVYAPVKPSWFLKYGNMPHLIFIKYCDIDNSTSIIPAGIYYVPDEDGNMYTFSIWANITDLSGIAGDLESDTWYLEQ